MGIPYCRPAGGLKMQNFIEGTSTNYDAAGDVTRNECSPEQSSRCWNEQE